MNIFPFIALQKPLILNIEAIKIIVIAYKPTINWCLKEMSNIYH
jgi:hypothetical protein